MAQDSQDEPLGLKELVAIALGGMVGGGIFTVLGIAVAEVGVWAPLAIALGGVVAALAAYSYVRLALHFRDEGAAYSFFKRSFPHHDFAAALIGWWAIFGYVSTIALYSFTFASYAISSTAFASDPWARKAVALAVIGVFAWINVLSTKGMGRIEDMMVYTKLAILVLISGVLWLSGGASLPDLAAQTGPVSLLGVVTVAAVTFVAYEGFELVINATDEMARPERNIPRAIYGAVTLAVAIYALIALGAIRAIPFSDIIRNQEFALAAGAQDVLGAAGEALVIGGALLATMSAISGTLFGASRLMAAIAADGYMPAPLARHSGHIPQRAVLAMAGLAGTLVLIGNLRMILEFGSITFLLVSLLMAIANHKLRRQTGSRAGVTLSAMATLLAGTGLILWFEARTEPAQLCFVVALYAVLTLAARLYARAKG